MDSIHSQNYKNVEHIVMDGKSSDNTLDIVRLYENVKIVSEKDKGQTDAINKGFKLATGDILAWQNADDVYLPGTFEIVVEFFKNNPDVDVLYGSYQVINEDGDWMFDVHCQQWDLWKYSHGRFVPMQTTAFWRRTVYEKIGDLNIDLNFCMDVDFFAKASKYFNFNSLDVFMGQFRVHDKSKTHTPSVKQKVLKEMRSVLALNYNYNFFDHCIFSFYSVRSIVAEKIKASFFKKF